MHMEFEFYSNKSLKTVAYSLICNSIGNYELDMNTQTLSH